MTTEASVPYSLTKHSVFSGVSPWVTRPTIWIQVWRESYVLFRQKRGFFLARNLPLALDQRSDVVSANRTIATQTVSNHTNRIRRDRLSAHAILEVACDSEDDCRKNKRQIGCLEPGHVRECVNYNDCYSIKSWQYHPPRAVMSKHFANLECTYRGGAVSDRAWNLLGGI